MNSEDLSNFLNMSNYIIKKYPEGNMVVIEGSNCEELGILLEGLLEAQTLYPSGKLLAFSQLRPVEIFGEAILLPAYSLCIVVSRNSSYIYILISRRTG